MYIAGALIGVMSQSHCFRHIAWLESQLLSVAASCGGAWALVTAFSGDCIMHLLLLVQYGLVNNIIVRAALL